MLSVLLYLLPDDITTHVTFFRSMLKGSTFAVVVVVVVVVVVANARFVFFGYLEDHSHGFSPTDFRNNSILLNSRCHTADIIRSGTPRIR